MLSGKCRFANGCRYFTIFYVEYMCWIYVGDELQRFFVIYAFFLILGDGKTAGDCCDYRKMVRTDRWDLAIPRCFGSQTGWTKFSVNCWLVIDIVVHFEISMISVIFYNITGFTNNFRNHCTSVVNFVVQVPGWMMRIKICSDAYILRLILWFKKTKKNSRNVLYTSQCHIKILDLDVFHLDRVRLNLSDTTKYLGCCIYCQKVRLESTLRWQITNSWYAV